MAATTSNATPRKNGFDFAALTASAGKQDSVEEVARLRAALETLAELVIAHGVMDARTLESIVGDLIQPPMVPVSLSAPLPPPAPSAAEALLRGPLPKPAPIASRPASRPAPIAARPAPAPVAARPAPAPVAARPAPAPIAQPAPVAAKPAPAPVAAKPAPAPIAQPAPVVHTPVGQMAPVAVTAEPMPAPQPLPVAVKAEPMPQPAPVEAVPTAIKPEHTEPLVPPSSVQPVVASPFPSEPARPRRNPFDAKDAARLEAELTEAPSAAAPKSGFFSRLFGKGKTSPAQVAKVAASIEFTERVPKLPVDGLYAEQQRATELSFPPTESVPRKKRPTPVAQKAAARPVQASAAKVCDRCWRRMDASGTCKTCSPSASA
jgi:hypothetical protein